MKKKINCEVNIPVTIFKEAKYYVAYSPALDLSTSAKTFSKVKERFSEIVAIFIEELVKKGTIDEVLESHGWKKEKEKYLPPVMISQQIEKFCIAAK